MNDLNDSFLEHYPAADGHNLPLAALDSCA